MTIMDQALSLPTPFWDRAMTKRLAALRYQAKRFVFTAEASAAAGRLAIECGDLILNNRQFAIPPFPVTYIEYDSRSFYPEGVPTFGPKETSDTRIGYLVDGTSVYVFVEAPIKDPRIRGPAPGMFRYRFVPPGQAYIPGNLDTLMDGWWRLANALGTTIHQIQSEEQRVQLLNEIGIDWIGAVAPPLDKLARLLQGGAGELRNLWALLLWINQPAKVQFTDQPAGAHMMGNKRVAYMQHRVVNIELGKIKNVRRALHFENRASPINHPVRGEFHHRGGDVNCSHVWPLLPNEKGHWYCANCNRLRYWVKEHRRGDATKGYSDASYEVTVP